MAIPQASFQRMICGNQASLRLSISEPPARRSHTEIEGSMLAFGVGLDIDAVEHQRRKNVGDRQQPNGQVLPDVDGSRSWDLPLDSSHKLAKVERRAFWEQSHWAEQWSLLMDRPRRGNRNSAWKPEVPLKLETWDDLPDDVQARLREIKCDLDSALAKKHGRAKTRGPSSRAAAKSSKELPVPTIWDALYDAPWRDSFEKEVEDCKPPGSSRASTKEGVASPEVFSSTPGTARSTTSESECGDGVFHIVNDPKGKHALLRQPKNDKVAVCQQLALPLGLRRVMCAVLPADPESSLQISGEQMQKLSGLHDALRTQKRLSRLAYKFPQKRSTGRMTAR